MVKLYSHVLVAIGIALFNFRGDDIKLNNNIDGVSWKINNQVPGNKDRFNIDLLFNVPDKLNMQGITYHEGFFYIGFDIGKGKGKIIQYDTRGRKVKESLPLNIGHSAELAYRKANGNIYVVNGGGDKPSHVYEVDFSQNTPVIVRDLNFEGLGNSALLCIDNERDELILHTASNDRGNPLFTICDFDGKVKSKFMINNVGIPQGLEYHKGLVYFYTNNLLTIISSNGNYLSRIEINKNGESQGLCLMDNYSMPYLAFGYNNPNRIYVIKLTDSKIE